MPAETTILVTLLAYQLVLLAIGLAARARTRDETDFYLGGRRLGPVVSAVGASASSSSVWTLLGVSGAAYAWGLSAVWLVPACVGGFVFNWLVVAPAVQRHSRASGAMTLVEMLGGGRGGAVVVLGASIVLVSLGAYVANQFQGVGKTLETLYGIAPWQSVLIGATVILAYTSLGGLWAVGLTDTLQGLLMAATAVVLPVAALIEIGGPAALLDALSGVDAAGYASLVGERPPLVALAFVAGVLGIGLGYPGQPHVVKYFMALREAPDSVAVARRVAIGWAVVVYTGMVVLGLCGRVLVPSLADGERVFIEATSLLFSPVVSGVMIAAVLSAIMSTADSQLLVASSTIAHDLGGAHDTDARSRSPVRALLHVLTGGPLLKRLVADASRRAVWRSRVVVFLLTAGAAITAVVGDDDIFSGVLFAWTAMGAAFGPLLVVRVVFGRDVSERRSLAAMSAGFLLAVLGYELGAIEVAAPLMPYKGFVERVLPFVVAFWVARGGAAASDER